VATVISIEDLHHGDEERAHRLGRQAFSSTEPFDPDRPGVGEGRHMAAYLDGTLVGQVRRLGFGQYFGGRRLACAGISGVAVAPQARSRNLARRMVIESLERAAADGELIAALYPTTAALYRSVGFEVAGWWNQVGVPISELPSVDGSVTWETADFDDPRLPLLYDQMAPEHDGWLDPGSAFWTLRATQAKKDDRTNRYLYIGSRSGQPVAAVQYSYGQSETSMYRLDVEAIYGIDGTALRAALALLGSHGTTADEIRTVLPLDELELHLSHVQRAKVLRSWPWMLAFVDLPGAIAARGYPDCVAGSLQLAVGDPLRPANAGSWVLSVAGAKASLEPGGDGHVEVTAPDLAAVFTGHLDPLRLARAGRLGHPSPADIDLLRTVFTGHPSLTIFF
jgi:predicted acetyltransferase